MAYLILIAIGLFLLMIFLKKLELVDRKTIVAMVKTTILSILVVVGILFLAIGRISLAIVCLLLLGVIFGRDIKNWFENRSKSKQLSAPMDLQEAYEILGLSEGATKKEILSAYRKAISQNHPDKGGSPYMARKINEAKEILLKTVE